MHWTILLKRRWSAVTHRTAIHRDVNIFCAKCIPVRVVFASITSAMIVVARKTFYLCKCQQQKRTHQMNAPLNCVQSAVLYRKIRNANASKLRNTAIRRLLACINDFPSRFHRPTHILRSSGNVVRILYYCVMFYVQVHRNRRHCGCCIGVASPWSLPRICSCFSITNEKVLLLSTWVVWRILWNA